MSVVRIMMTVSVFIYITKIVSDLGGGGVLCTNSVTKIGMNRGVPKGNKSDMKKK